jgi:diguanylate cyclase (GGDEF)-like protein/putative nucleotidyltransferase with HDIG domain
LSALVLDLDSFKQVNDLHGHQSGDAVLCAVARTLEAGCRLGDLAGRLGGEEFLVVLPDASSRTAWLVAERLRGAIAALDLDGSPGVTASFGVACFPAHGATAAGLLRAADSAMYDAKELGRNRSIVFDPRTAATRTERTELAQAGREGYLGSVIALAAAVDARDAWTHAHSETVARYAAGIASQLGLDGDQVEELRIAGLLHDVGKVGVPDRILLKPSRLTAAEFELMKSHTLIGAEILAGSSWPVLQMAEEIAISHHERWDGTGYPDGKIEDQIPMSGRIVIVADNFDALTHSRPYAEAWDPDKAASEIRRQSGQHFDPDVVEAFGELDLEFLLSPMV